jgi:catechol 2,3-dioxygenase-like lactoylglutathione lyase family enzyme
VTTSVDPFCIHVSDLKRSVRFYEQALGLALLA